MQVFAINNGGVKMKVTTYTTELDQNKHVVLVEERSYNYNEEVLDRTGKVVLLLNSLFTMNKLAEEHVFLISLTANMKVLGVFDVFHGAANYCIVNEREIFIRLLLTGAVNFILGHNHPSGDVAPSKSDMSVTDRLMECSRLMGIKFIDHIIIGDNDYFSFNEEKIFK